MAGKEGDLSEAFTGEVVVELAEHHSGPSDPHHEPRKSGNSDWSSASGGDDDDERPPRIKPSRKSCTSAKSGKSAKSSKSVGMRRVQGRQNTVVRSITSAEDYIAVKYDDLVAWFLRDHEGCSIARAGKDAGWVAAWTQAFRLLPIITLIRTRDGFRELNKDYQELDPDMDETKDARLASMPRKEGELPRGWDEKFRQAMRGLLATSGFARVSQETLDVADKKTGKYGLDVRVPPEEEVKCHVYSRGQYSRIETARTWSNCFCAPVEVQELCFKEVVFVYHYELRSEEDMPEGICDQLTWRWHNLRQRRVIGPKHSSGKIFMRCYKDIPQYDVDLLWPGAVPNPKLLDTLMIFVPFLIGFCSACWKIVGLATQENDLTQRENLIVVLSLIVAPFLVSFKAFTQAQNKYTLYKQHQAETLVEHTLSTNRGTMTQLLTEAAEQDNKEVCTAYTVMALAAPERLSMEELQRRCLDVVHNASGNSGSGKFDAVGAVTLLRYKGLLLEDADGMTVIEPRDARTQLSLSRYEQTELALGSPRQQSPRGQAGGNVTYGIHAVDSLAAC